MNQSAATVPGADPPGKKPVRFKIGVGLLVLWAVMLLAAAAIPFTSLDLATKSAAIAADLIAAEAIGLLGTVLIGKEAYQAMKARLMRSRRRKRR